MCMHATGTIVAGAVMAQASAGTATNGFVILVFVVAPSGVVHCALRRRLHAKRQQQGRCNRLGCFHISGNHRRRVLR